MTPVRFGRSAELRERIRANSSVSLGRYFRGLARASVAASVIAASGIAASGCSSPWPEDNPQFREPLCLDGQWRAAHGIEASREYDYLAVYSFGNFDGLVHKVDETGMLCATASDRDACETAVAASSEVTARHVVLTEGDEVIRVQTEAELLGLLGEVNAPEEAALVVWHRGHTISCGDIERTAVREVAGGWEVVAWSITQSCDPVEEKRFLFHVGRDGMVTQLDDDVLSSQSGVCIGRRPQGLQPASWTPELSGRGSGDVAGSSDVCAGSGSVARYFAEGARLEAGAVLAFDDLARELAHHGAPESLVEEARRAACDEVRHADLVGGLARRFGIDPVAPEVHPRPIRTLVEMALDNAAEGCVRETFGALVGTYQAVQSEDREVAWVMAGVAADETRHASLAWRIAEWLDAKLDHAEREQVRAAMCAAVARLRVEMREDPAASLRETAGLPSSAAALALLEDLDATLWRSAAAW